MNKVRLAVLAMVAVIIVAFIEVTIVHVLRGLVLPPPLLWARAVVLEILRTTLWMYFWAIFLHVAALAGLGAYSFSSQPKQDASATCANESSGVPLYSASTPPFSDATLEQRLARSLQNAEHL